MDEWFIMLKNNPLGAIGMVLGAGTWWVVKNVQEKRGDSKEVGRMAAALADSRAVATTYYNQLIEANEARDDAIAKQIELVERFSETRAQSERLLERMDGMSNNLDRALQDNSQLREQVQTLTDQVQTLTEQNNHLSRQVQHLQSTINNLNGQSSA